MSNLQPCKHLDHDPEHYPSCELRTIMYGQSEVKYWERKSFYEGQPTKVQFCKKRGRVNEILACYGEMNCYELKEVKFDEIS
jgi:hypothetical protein